MNKQEFLDAALRQASCPGNFPEIYDEFQKYQELAMDTLREVHRICEKNGIEYELAYGSLLGAIRDNGQIPWDYDVDILVAYSRRNDLFKALKKDLSSEYYIYSYEADSRCAHQIMRVTPNGYNSIALHVDIFFYIGTSSDQSERIKHGNEITRLTNQRRIKLIRITDMIQKDTVYKLKVLLRKIAYFPLSADAIQYKLTLLCGKYPLKPDSNCIHADAYATRSKMQYLYQWLSETKLIHTSSGTFRVSVHFDEILKRNYGDYQTYPALNTRIKEVIERYNEIKAYMA